MKVLWSSNLGANIANGLLVWRSELPEEETAGVPSSGGATAGNRGEQPRGGEAQPVPRSKGGQPRRFYGSITLDPDKVGLQVAKIAEEILFELGRPQGATLRLTLEVDATSPDGFPDDVVDVVRSNIRDLKLNANDIGFEED